MTDVAAPEISVVIPKKLSKIGSAPLMINAVTIPLPTATSA